MSASDVAKLAALLAELDRLCAEALKIRAKIGELTHQPSIFPDRRDRSRVFEQPVDAQRISDTANRERSD